MLTHNKNTRASLYIDHYHGYTCGVAMEVSLISSVGVSGGVAVGVATSACKESSLVALISGVWSDRRDCGGVA